MTNIRRKFDHDFREGSARAGPGDMEADRAAGRGTGAGTSTNGPTGGTTAAPRRATSNAIRRAPYRGCASRSSHTSASVSAVSRDGARDRSGLAGRGPAGISRRRPRRLCGDESDPGPTGIYRGALYRDQPLRAGPGGRCPRDQHRRHARPADRPGCHRGRAARGHGRRAPGPGPGRAPQDDHGGRLNANGAVQKRPRDTEALK
jgi:hypothetical protein